MELPKDLKDEIWEYCRLNDITDLNAFMVRMLRQGYTTEKYGPTPFKIGQSEPQIVEKEVIKEVEKIVEVPVEVVVEKEVIKEVTVEIEKIVEVIKEVPIEVIREVIIEKQGEETEKWVEKEVIVEKLVEVPVEVIKEIEKIVEVPIEVIKEVEKIVEIGDPKKVKKLEQQIENLKIELELEKNRRLEKKKVEQPKEDVNQRGLLGNVISWVSKSERDKKDLYEE
jgi:hypothetical protein